MLLRAGADPNDGDERHPIGEALYAEGGPTMQTDQEIPQAPYREVQRLLREAGATE
jgi:hypothetical protein